MNSQTYAERTRLLNPIDDDFLKKMAEDTLFCQEVIRTILEDEDLVVLESSSQHTIKNLQGRSVILDILCRAGSGKVINVEVQKENDVDHQRRVRYHASCITANITDTGSKFKDILDLCIIYISKSDFFKEGKTVYHIDRIIRETGTVVENGLQEIYVNASNKDDSNTSKLMTIFTESDAYDDVLFPVTSKRKRYFKEDKKGVAEMCAIMDEIREEGRLEGKEEGRWENKLEVAENLLKMGDNVLKVIQVTQLPPETVQTMADKLLSIT
ncbi:MAG: Rpn family recombination-promoting nuclease/putative transposase [Robinsoniella sp.]|nr:Rpn family recombination-promoting nuclease/putative transposase [Robinsoniella sp.]